VINEQARQREQTREPRNDKYNVQRLKPKHELRFLGRRVGLLAETLVRMLPEQTYPCLAMQANSAVPKALGME
jgi:hypothetical protein